MILGIFGRGGRGGDSWDSLMLAAVASIVPAAHPVGRTSNKLKKWKEKVGKRDKTE